MSTTSFAIFSTRIEFITTTVKNGEYSSTASEYSPENDVHWHQYHSIMRNYGQLLRARLLAWKLYSLAVIRRPPMQSKKVITLLLILTSLSLLAVMALYVKLDTTAKSLSDGNTTTRSCCGTKGGCNNK
jgi:hypothetical protein